MKTDKLQAIGFTQKELDLYELLLKVGEVDAGRLIAETRLKRPTVYKSLYSLVEKGLVIQRELKGKSFFRPEPPEKLASIADSRIGQLEQARTDITALLPELTASYLLSVQRPVVSVFEGVSGLKKVFEDTLNEGQEIFALLQTGPVEPMLAKWLEEVYVPKRVEKGIRAKVIVASSKGNSEYVRNDEKALRTTVVVPGDKFPFKHELNIYGSKVAYINYAEGDKLIGVVINHQRMADSMRAWFDLAWQGASKL